MHPASLPSLPSRPLESRKSPKYQSFLRPDDKPAIWLNQKIMEQYRPRMKAFYYDPSKYDTYLEQLGIKYPTVRESPPSAPQ